MSDLLLEIALPRTDAGVAVQWIVAAAVWLVLVIAVWRQPRDIQLFAWGLIVMNLALFSLRTVH